MKKLFASLMLGLILFMLPTVMFAQAPAAPSNGIWAIIDTDYTLGSSAQGFSKAKITLQNTTSTLITGVQFRVFYDNNAFNSASVALLGSTSLLDLQQVDNNAAGYITITLVYTGSSASYTLPTDEVFEITFNHVAPSAFFALPSIANLSWTGSATFNQLAAAQDGTDTTLSLHNYGGAWLNQTLTYSGNFTNVTGTPAKNLPFSLEKKPQSGSTWTVHNTYLTDNNGNFTFTENIDTSYYDVRLSIQGDTMTPGNVISTADAQLINQWVLGTATPSGFDFYSADVNGSNSITITDAYGVFGRIAGRFTSWPNNVKDVKFFTAAEYATITGAPTTNFTSTIPGVTNFYHDILPGQNNVTFYVLVPGDANGTGYHMARLTPITVLPTPIPGYPLENENIIDMSVEYDFPTSVMEVRMPSLMVNEGSLVEIPVTVKTNGKEITALQLGMIYDETLLQFKELQNSEKSMFWLSSINPTGGIVEWAGYDPSPNKTYMIPDNYEIFKLKFIALKPQNEWGTSPLYTTRKFSGDNNSKDMTITPANGVLVVAKISSATVSQTEMIVFPNPTTGELNIDFDVKEAGRVNLYIVDMKGTIQYIILDKDMPAGSYIYSCNIENLAQGIYIASLQSKNQGESSRIIKK